MNHSPKLEQSNLDSSKPNLFFILAILSGACGLAYQVAYVRLFSNYFGDSFIISGVTLFSVFIGIAFGAWKSHRFIKQLAYIELGIGLYSLCVATLFSFWGFDIVGFGNQSLLNIGKLVVLLLVPTFLIGTCVPLFSQYISFIKNPGKSVFTHVYTLYNLGAFLSVIAIEFFLFRQLGLLLTFYVVGSINFIIGLSLLSSKVATNINRVEIKTPKRQVAVALFLASLASGIFQLYALQISFLIFGPLSENFAIILTSAIMGIAIGSSLAMFKATSLKQAIIGSGLGSLIFLLFVPVIILLWSKAPSLNLNNNEIIALKIFLLAAYPLSLFIPFGALVPLAVRSHKKHRLEVVDSLLALSSLANGLGALLMFLILYRYLSLLQIGFVIFSLLTLSYLVLIGGLKNRDELKKRSTLLFEAIAIVLAFFAIYFWPRIELLLGDQCHCQCF